MKQNMSIVVSFTDDAGKTLEVGVDLLYPEYIGIPYIRQGNATTPILGGGSLHQPFYQFVDSLVEGALDYYEDPPQTVWDDGNEH